MRRAVCIMAIASFPSLSLGAINLQIQPVTSPVNVGQPVGINIFASPSSGSTEALLSFQMIFTWNTAHLQLTGHSVAGAPSYTGAGFPNDPYGLNGPGVPSDGNAIFVVFGPLGGNVPISPGGTFLGRLNFNALSPTAPGGTPINILATGGAGGTTTVFGAGGPNLDVTGILSGTFVTIIPAPMTASVLALGGVMAMPRRRRP